MKENRITKYLKPYNAREARSFSYGITRLQKKLVQVRGKFWDYFLQVDSMHFNKILRWGKNEKGLVWFYGVSTIVGCLKSNTVFAYILNI